MGRGTIWCAASQATARNMFERGVSASDIADTLNRLFPGLYFTSDRVRARMHYIGARWASRLDGDQIAIETTQAQRAGRAGAIGRMFYLDSLQAFDRPRPWNPATDPKPAFLHLNLRTRHAPRS